jgi:integrase/recombinase XerD
MCMSRSWMRVISSSAKKDTHSPLFRAYLVNLERRSFSPRTIETYADCLRMLSRWMGTARRREVRRLTLEDLRAFQVWLSELVSARGRPYAAARQAYHISVVRSFFAWLRAQREILVDPALSLRYPKLPRRLAREVLSEEELGRLLAQPNGSPWGLRDAVALRLLVLCGLRVSELAGVDVKDVDLGQRELLVRRGKGARERLVFFNAGTRVRLARYLVEARPRLARRREPALLVGQKGRRLQVSGIQNAVRRYALAAGLDRRISPHSLRHTFCTLLLRHGANMKVIADLAGHRSMATTARYARVEIGQLGEVYRSAHPRGGGC